MVQQGLHNDVLLHHVQGQVLAHRHVVGRPHQGGPENNGQVRDLHPVVILELCHFEQVL